MWRQYMIKCWKWRNNNNTNSNNTNNIIDRIKAVENTIKRNDSNSEYIDQNNVDNNNIDN